MYDEEIYSADILRSLTSIGDAWESDEDLDIETMTLHLEEMIEVVKGVSDYREFIKKAGLKDIKYN